VILNAALPPDATGATLLAIDGELATAIAPPVIEPVDVVVRYVDSDVHDGCSAAAAGVHAEETLTASTIAPRPTDGEIRKSRDRRALRKPERGRGCGDRDSVTMIWWFSSFSPPCFGMVVERRHQARDSTTRRFR
jgi:hypothetical protein